MNLIFLLLGPVFQSRLAPTFTFPQMKANIGKSNINSVVNIKLEPRPMTIAQMLANYSPYVMYAFAEKNFAMRLFRGIFLGRPALDIQLIHATLYFSKQRAVKEQNNIDQEFMSVIKSAEIFYRTHNRHRK